MKRRPEQLMLSYFEQMVLCFEREMSAPERAELEAWERTHLDGATVSTSDWPGWERRIGKPPASEHAIVRRRSA